MRIKPLLLCAAFAALLFRPFSVLLAQGADLEGKIVSAINITCKRTSPSEILSRIPLKTGGKWTAAAEAKTRTELHDMGVFRKLEVVSHYDEAAGGVIVDINADDGWYVLPLPLLTSGSSGGGFSLMLLSGNLFHRAETIFLRGSVGKDTSSAMGGLATDNWFFSANGASSSSTENLYSDGAYNTLAATPDTGKVGQPVNWYARKSEQHSFSVARKLNDNHNVGVMFSQAKYILKDAAVPIPDEPGRHNTLGLSYTYTQENNGGISKQGGGMGVLFGLGLSDLQERLTLRNNIGSLHVVDVKGFRAGNYIGSEYDYSALQLSWRGVWEFPKRDKLAFRVSGAKGWTLPFTQLIATGPMLGLRGQYRREWRGNQGAGGTASFSYFLSRSKRGLLVMEPFAESAFVWNGNTRYNQSGAGVNFYYQFWRFPMPLGLGYTWSFADKEGVVSMAAGFGFGK